MGFTSGLLGGITLTSTILYLTISIHRQNRLAQSSSLQQQDQLLRNVLSPPPPAPLPSAREERVGLTELAKDRWNAEVTTLVRKVNETDWAAVRADMEERIRQTFTKMREAAAGTEIEAVVPATAKRREG